MPPKTPKAAASGDSPDGRKQPTAQETYLFYTIIKNMIGRPEIDWAQVAIDAGFKNAETAKVRYGQIKRKLGLDTWNLTKPKTGNDENAGEDATPETPATARSKKTTSTPGTGAGVKKRGAGKRAANNTTPAAGRGRKAAPKSRALIKMSEGEDEDDEDLDNDMDMAGGNELLDPESPTGNIKKRIKAEFGSGNSGTNNNPNSAIPDFTRFPLVIPDLVLERKAILVSNGGNWTLSPAPLDVHAQWLARLPAHIQSQFYAQAQGVPAMSMPHGGNNDNIGNGYLPVNNDGEQAYNMHHATPAMHGGISTGLPVSMAVNMGYMPAAAAGIAAAGGNGQAAAHNNNGGDIDLHSIPVHPDYAKQMEREQREQEARDQETLFGGGGAGGHEEHY